MATTKLPPDIPLPDDVLRTLVDALATLVLLDLETPPRVEVALNDGLEVKQDVKSSHRPRSRRQV
jgi:hypothetical protein